MRPPGAPRFCPNHGYACKDNGGGRSYGVPGGMRTGGGGSGHRLPFGGFGPGIPVFKMGAVDQDRSPCTCEVAEDGEKKWIDWRGLFPDRDWYAPSSQKREAGATATEKLRLLHDEADKREMVPESKLKKSLGPRTIANTRGTMPLIEKEKQKPNHYDLFH